MYDCVTEIRLFSRVKTAMKPIRFGKGWKFGWAIRDYELGIFPKDTHISAIWFPKNCRYCKINRICSHFPLKLRLYLSKR